MAPGLPRTPSPTPFNSPALVRLLAAWASAGQAAPADPHRSLAERLGPWLDWTDAITLSAALNQASVPTDPGPATPAAALAQRVARAMAEQARLVRTDPVYLQRGHGAQADDLAAAHSADSVTDVAPYRRACQARQRAMAGAASTLRAELRSALAATSPDLARLAALDATLEAALGERERHLLGGVVARIEQRFLQLRQDAALGWLARFHHDMQQALLAELDLRLQPIQGLLDALTSAITAAPTDTQVQVQVQVQVQPT